MLLGSWPLKFLSWPLLVQYLGAERLAQSLQIILPTLRDCTLCAVLDYPKPLVPLVSLVFISGLPYTGVCAVHCPLPEAPSSYGGGVGMVVATIQVGDPVTSRGILIGQF